jgi:hypothetical protein
MSSYGGRGIPTAADLLFFSYRDEYSRLQRRLNRARLSKIGSADWPVRTGAISASLLPSPDLTREGIWSDQIGLLQRFFETLQTTSRWAPPAAVSAVTVCPFQRGTNTPPS